MALRTWGAWEECRSRQKVERRWKVRRAHVPPGPWCFRHQVLLRCDRHVHDGGSGRPARVSERPHVAQPQDNAPQGHEDVPQLPNASSLALSPDGRTLIYTGPDALYRRDMEQLDVQRLPGTDGAT